MRVCFAVDGVGSSDGAGTQRQSCYIICCSLGCCKMDLIIGKEVESVFWKDQVFCLFFCQHPKLPKRNLANILIMM